MAYYMMGQEDAARPVLERAVKLNKGAPAIEEARECLAILSLDAAKEGDNARTLLNRALEKRKDDPIALSRLAVLHERDGSVDKALAAYETALKANPSNANAAAHVIRLYRSRNETAKALELARATRKLAPADGRIAHALGRLSYESGDRMGSVSVLREAARRLEGDPEVLFDLAEASYSIGQISAAETAFREALAAVPSFPRAAKAREYLELIALFQNPAQAAAATTTIDGVLKSDATHVPALMARGMADEQKGDVKAAKQNYEKALARFPDFSPARRQLTILYSSHPEDDKRALDLATKAREAFPNDPEVAKGFGIILFRQGNHARAATLLQESARARVADAEIMYYLGMAQQQLKESAASTRSLQRALELGLSDDLAAKARRALVPAK
jgi:Flp pilus assembly protein TadD